MDRKQKCVYINPNFRCPLQPEVIRAHINPLFANKLVNNRFENEDYLKQQNVAQPKIHINPRMINILPNMYKDPPKDVKNDVIIKSNTKFSKVNIKPSKTFEEPPKAIVTNVLPIVKPRKPCYSLVRNVVTNPVPVPVSYKNLEVKPSKKWNNDYIDKRKLSLIKANRKSLSKINSPKIKSIKSSKLDNSLSSNKLNKSFVSTVDSVFIGGEKYLMKGNKLVRLVRSKILKNKNNKLVNQILLKGKTYVRKSENVFIANVSPRKMKKVNVPCPVFRRIGVCKKFDKGKCNLLHDRKHITICRKFLQGACKVEGCLLSHSVILEKMPACKFYLEGCCTRDVCPYLHVKLDKNANVCMQFLQGFCEAGKECLNVHMNICPEFYKSGKCNKVKCSYPHKSVDFSSVLQTDVKQVKEKKVVVKECVNKDVHVEDTVKRYYLENDCDNDISKIDDNEDVQSLAKSIHNRAAIGDLPSFIAL